ncbi:hypothetical protein SGLAM104S_08211 [Streptomyces glaucescens]
MPFEFSRIVLPAAGDLLPVEVWAPRHDHLRPESGLDGVTTAPAFSLDPTKRYFAVLAALCEPRLRGAPHAPLPTVDQVVDRLRPGWPAASRASVQWNIDYLAVKLRLKPGPETADAGPAAQRQEGVPGVAGAPLRPGPGGGPRPPRPGAAGADRAAG